VVEVFPPIIPPAVDGGSPLRLADSMESYVGSIKEIQGIADVILVASLKKQDQMALPPIEAALHLRKKLGLDAAPVLVVRNENRLQLLSSVVEGLVGGLKSMMLVWGDSDLPRRSPLLLGFSGLSEALQEASQVRDKTRSRCRFFAPVDLRRLFTTAGVALAKNRLATGASFLLAQPPTTDAAETFDSHSKLIRTAGLEGKVLPSVFPFKNLLDVKECERYFGWRLPRELHEAAKEGGSSLLGTQSEVIRRLRSERFPGVYISTRGTPGLAKILLS